MSLPSRGEKFAELVEYLRKAAEAAAMIGHLTNDTDGPSRVQAKGWLAVCQLLEEMVKRVTRLATSTKWYH
jgi:soluble P-type ATPase